jgi:hypothetical protein
VPGGAVGSCDKDIEQLGGPSLHGASVTAQRTTGPATTWLYETKTAWIVCDDLTASDGGAPTLFAPHDKAEAYQPSVSTLNVSDNLITRSGGTWRYAQFVAGGRDFDGVQAISYAFPDGHVEDAVVGQNVLWSMNYLATGGLFLQHGTNVTKLDPIKVTVHFTNEDVKTFSLRWGPGHLCADQPRVLSSFAAGRASPVADAISALTRARSGSAPSSLKMSRASMRNGSATCTPPGRRRARTPSAAAGLV